MNIYVFYTENNYECGLGAYSGFVKAESKENAEKKVKEKYFIETDKYFKLHIINLNLIPELDFDSNDIFETCNVIE
jgi:hypothetical protein